MTDIKRLSTIRVTALDMDGDEQVWIQSDISATHKLHKGLRDDFSFVDTSLLMIPNVGETPARIRIEAFQCAEGGIFIGSNRRAGVTLRQGDVLNAKMRGRETLTVRSIAAREPGSKDGDGNAVMIRPGQAVAVST